MKDYRKFCRPRFTKIPKLGDIVVKLKCGEIKAMTQDEYIKVQRFFNIYSFVGESSNSSGNIVVVNKETGKKAIFSSDDYDSIKDEFDIVDIVGNKQNPFNNHEYVDLGLPSGTLWATMNVGATSEGELGDYYKFGETTVYDGTDYNTSAYDLAEDLSLENDAANVNWSGDWHIPTRSQWNELISNTTHTYISDYNSSGINVIKFAKTNDSSTFIILPAGGSYTDGEQTNPDTAYYWSNTQYYKSAYYAVFTQNSYFHIDWKTAYGHGFQVRPVCDSINSQRLAQEGDIICHNNILNQDAIFSFNDWLNVDSNWDLIGLYKITTYEEEDASNGDYVILANGHTLIIKPGDYSKVSTNWEKVDVIFNPEVVDLDLTSNTLWATTNVGAYIPEEYGNYYLYGKGSTPYDSADDNYYNGTDNPLNSAIDTATQVWGLGYHTPTYDQLLELYNETDYTWITINGITGGKFASKSNPNNYIFIPAAGAYGTGGSTKNNVGTHGYLYSSTPVSQVEGSDVYYLHFSESGAQLGTGQRTLGYSIRPVTD